LLELKGRHDLVGVSDLRAPFGISKSTWGLFVGVIAIE
jgi:hypothetical protein